MLSEAFSTSLTGALIGAIRRRHGRPADGFDRLASPGMG